MLDDPRWVGPPSGYTSFAERAALPGRCFLSAEPSADVRRTVLPAAILQGAIKVVAEPPRSLKANLLQAYAAFEDDDALSSACRRDEFR